MAFMSYVLPLWNAKLYTRWYWKYNNLNRFGFENDLTIENSWNILLLFIPSVKQTRRTSQFSAICLPDITHALWIPELSMVRFSHCVLSFVVPHITHALWVPELNIIRFSQCVLSRASIVSMSLALKELNLSSPLEIWNHDHNNLGDFWLPAEFHFNVSKSSWQLHQPLFFSYM